MLTFVVIFLALKSVSLCATLSSIFSSRCSPFYEYQLQFFKLCSRPASIFVVVCVFSFVLIFKLFSQLSVDSKLVHYSCPFEGPKRTVRACSKIFDFTSQGPDQLIRAIHHLPSQIQHCNINVISHP
jgi:hypothetical protein